jgi:hypothetical protein
MTVIQMIRSSNVKSLFTKIIALGWIAIFTCIGACTPASETTTIQPRATPTPSIQVTDTPPPIPSITSSPTLVPFHIPRAETHNLIFSNSTETEQTIYSYDYEMGTYSEIFLLPTDMSLYQGGRTVGLPPSFMFLSPDAMTLITLQYGTIENPQNDLHQIDLLTGEVFTIKLFENGQWAIPIVPGRKPGQEDEDAGFQDDISIIGLFNTLVWAPDSSGFVFTLGENIAADSEGYHYNGQLYYVQRGSDTVVPLAVDAPGNDIGFDANWSPRGNYISYYSETGPDAVWVIDMENSSNALPIIPSSKPFQIMWYLDESSILFSRPLFFEPPDFTVHYNVLARFYVPEGEIQYLIVEDENPYSNVLFDLVGQMPVDKSFIVIERHEIDDKFDTTLQKILYIDLETCEILSLLEGQAISEAFILPVDGLIWVTFDESQEGAFIKVPSGEIVLGPSSHLYPPTDEEIQYAPSYDNWGWHRTKAQSKSSDMHLIAGYQGDEVVIWDILTGEFTIVAEDLPGRKVFLGWVPDLDE